MPKIRFKQGDIVWADFSPSVGQEMKGKHPAVVVSSNSYNEKTNYLSYVKITVAFLKNDVILAIVKRNAREQT